MFPSANLSPCFDLTTAANSFGDEKALLDLFSHCLLEIPMNKPGSCSAKGTTSTGPEVVYQSSGDDNRLHDHKHRRSKSENKDQYSKIFTAQGPRDRRVRLSKDIARRFFDLQDLLGFDRASKTLDWLLTKSKTAIKELIQMKDIDIDPSARSLYCFSSECEDLEYLKKKKKKKKKSTAAGSKKKRSRTPANLKETKALQMVALAKELRAKARARARERTEEKKLLRDLIENNKKLPYLNPYTNPNRASSWSEIGSWKTSQYSDFHSGMNGFFCSQPNLIISTESSSKFSGSPNTAENWDISSTVTSSNLCALTNMNSSAVLQICRKAFDFEECNNNINERPMW